MWRRAAWVAERPRGTDALCVRREAGGRGTPAGAARTDAPRVAATCGRPRNACGGLRGPRSRACGDLRGPRNACGRPAEPPREADAPRVRRPAECLPNARGGRCPRRTTQGGRVQRPPKRLSSPLPGACSTAGPPGLRPAGTVRPRIRRHAR